MTNQDVLLLKSLSNRPEPTVHFAFVFAKFSCCNRESHQPPSTMPRRAEEGKAVDSDHKTDGQSLHEELGRSAGILRSDDSQSLPTLPNPKPRHHSQRRKEIENVSRPGYVQAQPETEHRSDPQCQQ